VNAAIYGAGDIEFSPLEEYRRLAEVNLFGLVRVTKKFIRFFLIGQSETRIVYGGHVC
jgi:NAD(P)-dependent dehydrogenase (short-subunit alcohol dehydrogenase family)